MKKRYVIYIIGILTLMILSVVIYAFKIMDSSGNSFNLFSLSGIYGNSLTQSNGDEQNQMYNFMSQSSINSTNIDTVKNSIYTTTGYEGLSTSSERSCYNLIKSGCDKISNEIYKSQLYSINTIVIRGYKLSTTQIKKVLYAIQNDNPNIFWISSIFGYRYSGNNTILELNSVFSKDDQQKALEKLNNRVSEILTSIPKNLTAYETELFIHDYIIDHCKYEKISTSSKNNPKIFTSYGCLIEGSAVCEGYSKSMQLLMNLAGIKCRTVAGARDSEPHMWNIVKINGNWYHLDVTWDGAGDINRYNYFNVTDDIIKKDHIINEELSKTTKFSEDKRYNFKLPVCNEIKENYYEKNAVKINNLNNEANEKLIIKKLISVASAKKEFIYFMIDKNLNFETTKKQLLTEKPFKLFGYINTANKSLANGHKISNHQVQYADYKMQNVLIIKLNYS